MKKYVAKRSEVMSGVLTIAHKRTINVNFFGMFSDNISISYNERLRGMLFNINDEGLANDLIYTTSTNYLILGVESEMMLEDEPLLIGETANLEELLKYLRFGADLTQSDLNKIYRILITHDWWLKRHPELFGLFKVDGYVVHDRNKEIIPLEVAESLIQISAVKGKPHSKEPSYELIKRIK